MEKNSTLAETKAGRSKKRILFVDDEPSILMCFELHFEAMRDEWEVTFLTSAIEALQMMEKHAFDVIVSDMRMPGMNGAQFLCEVMRRCPQTIRFILSGYAEQEAVAKCVGAAHQFLMKPCDLQTLKSALTRVCALDVFVHNERLKALVSKMSVLPSVPSVYFKVLKELESPEVSTEKIGEIVRTDPAMTAKLLQLVNSAFFGIARSIANPTEAVQLLGVNTVRSLALSIHAFSVFEQSKGARFSLQQVWNHSLQTALAARKIAQVAGGELPMADEAFVVGLLHDLGKLMFSSNLTDEYERTASLAHDQQITISEAERTVFGASHADIGAYLLGLWGLPIAVVEGVALHHEPLKAINRSFSPLTAVHVANVLEHEMEPERGPGIASRLDEGYLAALGLNEKINDWRAAVVEPRQGRADRQNAG